MENGFKTRISRVLNSFLQCLLKEELNKPKAIDSLHHRHPTSPATASLRHVVASSLGCGCCRSKTGLLHPPTLSPPPTPPPSDFKWQEEEKWHVVTRVPSDDSSDDACQEIKNAAATAQARRKKQLIRNKKIKSRKKKLLPRPRVSTSSADHSGWFSSDGNGDVDDAETETLMCSSMTFSDDDDSGLEELRRPRKGSGRRATAAAGLSVMGVVGKATEGVAVVKRSEDPYGDFKRSMVEMIVEKELYEAEELHRLLRCFLSLNSSAHHDAILRAFSEIWERIISSPEAPPAMKAW